MGDVQSDVTLDLLLVRAQARQKFYENARDMMESLIVLRAARNEKERAQRKLLANTIADALEVRYRDMIAAEMACEPIRKAVLPELTAQMNARGLIDFLELRGAR